MRVTVERLPGSVVELDIIADDAEFAESLEKTYRKVAREVQVPGFRKGKAPRQIIERFVGREAIVDEAGREMMDDLYRRALESEHLIPVGDPRVGITQQEPIGFKVVVEVYPAVTLGDYKSVRVEPREVDITDEEVNEVIEQLRKTHSTWEVVEEARQPLDGEMVVLDVSMFAGEEQVDQPLIDATYVLGESQLFDALADAIKMMLPGTTAEVTLAFDEEDQTAAPHLRGKEVRYVLTLKQIKRRVPPASDDELAQKVSAEFANFDEMVAQLRKDLLRNKALEARAAVITEVINAMAETAQVEVPSAMVEQEIEDELTQFRSRLAQQRMTLDDYLAINDQTEEQLREEIRPNAERRVRNSLVLQEIAKAEHVEVTDEDIANEIEKLVAGSEHPDRLRSIYQSQHFRGLLESEIFDRKLQETVVAIATEGRGAVTGPGAEALAEAERPPAPRATAEAPAEEAAIEAAASDAEVEAAADTTVSPEGVAEIEEASEAVAAEPVAVEAGEDTPPAEAAVDDSGAERPAGS